MTDKKTTDIITDKDRLDFIEKNKLTITRIISKNNSRWCVGTEEIWAEYYDLRDAIDNAIMAIREKDK